jgi:hypothetical protein
MFSDVWGSRGRRTSCFQDLAGSLCAIGQRYTDNLVESGEFDLLGAQSMRAFLSRRELGATSQTHIVEDDQGPVDTSNGVVFQPRLDRSHAQILSGHVISVASRWELDDAEAAGIREA